MGVLNFALTLAVFATFVALFATQAVVTAVWNGLMRLLDSLFGSARAAVSRAPVADVALDARGVA